MGLRTYLPVAIAMILAAGLSLGAATIAVEKIETGSRVGVIRALSEDGLPWARVSTDGLQVRLHGTAPDEAARIRALSAAGRVVDATRVVDRMDVTPAQRIEAPEFEVEILRNLDGISLIGLVPAAFDRTEMLDRLGRIAETPITDLLQEANYPAPDGWEPAMAFALTALDAVPRSKVSVSAERIAVVGVVDSEAEQARVRRTLTDAAPDGIELVFDIAAPRPVIAPFTLRFVASGSARRFDACAAETEEARDRITAAARAVGARDVTCQIGLGAPSLDWDAAVVEGIEALDALGTGTITFSDADVSLIAPHTVPAAAFDRAVGQLERALPEGFSLTARRNPAPDDEEREAAPEGPAEFRAVRVADGGVELSGRLGSDRTRRAVESYAYALFGREGTEVAARIDDSVPQGWSDRAFAALDALAFVADGSVTMRPDSLSVTGTTGREAAASEIARMLAERLGSGAEYQIDVSYDERLDPELDIPTPEECVKDLNTVLSVQKLTFEPGSATLDGPSLEIVGQLADILKLCQDVPIEIAAHSDSQGRESMNLTLSQERADAVLNAILARRVLTTNLTAQGYGEAVPIADNGTEAGREANRRIEFTLLGGEETADADGDAETEGEDSDEQN